MERTIREFAHAKVNLSLDITGRRPDGYHLVRMIMQTVSLADTVEVTRKDPAGQRTEGVRSMDQNMTAAGSEDLSTQMPQSDAGRNTMTCSVPGIPTGSDNLCIRACDAVCKRYEIPERFQIRLTKRIPAAAGLAGGSADAAAVIRAVLRLTDRLDAVRQESEEDKAHGRLPGICRMAASLGADIPYCICGGTALSEGIGEVLTYLPAVGDISVLIAKPAVDVSTADAYRMYDALTTVRHPDTDRLIRLLSGGPEDRDAFLRETANVLEYVTGPHHPEIGILEDEMRSCGARFSMMSGSGPSVFGIFDDPEDMHRMAESLRREHPEMAVEETHTVGTDTDFGRAAGLL